MIGGGEGVENTTVVTLPYSSERCNQIVSSATFPLRMLNTQDEGDGSPQARQQQKGVKWATGQVT